MEGPWSFTAGAKSSQKRARFNLLALDHGEYYFQVHRYVPRVLSLTPREVLSFDYSAFFYPSSGVATATAHHRPKQQGRLKLCSRGLLFEPADRLSPLVKYPFYHMETQMEPIGSSVYSGWGGHSKDGARGRSSAAFRNGGSSGGLEGEAFRFRCTVVVESRKNDEVGPYVMKRAGGSGAAGEWNDWIFMFSLLHTPLEEFLTEARRLREVALRVKERGHGYEEPLLRPILEERLRDSTRKFDTIHLVDFRETLLLPTPVRVDRITPLLRNPGCIMVTDVRVYFQPAELNNVGERVASFDLSGVVRVFKRRHMLRQTGLELFMEGNGGSAFFNFESSRERDELFDVLMSQPLVGQRAQSARDIEAETRRWQAGQVSNYDYLVFLNTIAGRTVNDLTQYPVFPWVLVDYDSPTLNLDDPRVYRDLSRPIGALNAERLEYFRTRLCNMPDPALHPGQGYPPPFLYGTHYSTPGYALFFLVRAAPEEMLCLQNGRFDDPDRSFTSVKGAWESVLQNHADLKELIPEFYAGDGSFLTNVDDLQLGVTQGGQRVGDVELPPWARNPRDFVRKMRRALESSYVSRRLHLWIDLIFGCRQRGKAAVNADNLFYYLTYEGAVDLEKIDDPRERAALESQISEFGQCPSLLFRGRHPCRDAPLSPILVAPPFGNQHHLGMRNLPWGTSGENVDRGGDVAVLDGGDNFRRSTGESQMLQAVTTATPGVDQTHVSGDAGGGGGGGGGAGVVPSQGSGQQWQGVVGTSQSRRLSGSAFPSSSPSSPAGLMGGGLAVGSSVGALWKRGLAMAGVVSATAEAAGGRGGFKTTQGRQEVGAGDPVGEADRGVSRQHVVGSEELTHTSSLPPPPSAPDEEIDRVERSRSVPDSTRAVAGHAVANRIRASQHEIRYASHEGVHDSAVAAAGGGMGMGMGMGSSSGVDPRIANPDAALDSESAPIFNSPGPGGTRIPRNLESNAADSRSSGRSGDTHGSGNGNGNGSWRSGAATLPPALAGARGTRLWEIDAAKIELRPGEPMALHRDGVTCAHLVMGGAEGDGQVMLPSSAARDPSSSVPPSVAASGIESRLTLCTSSKDCSVKICHLQREAGVSRSVLKAHTRRRLAVGELPVSCCALTRDAKLAVAGSWDNGLLLYSVEAAAVLSKIDGAHEDGIRCLALHDVGDSVGQNAAPSRWRDGNARRMLATGSWDAAVKVWDVRPSEIDPSPVLELFDLEAAVQALAFDGAGRVLAAAGEDGMVALWDVSTGSVLATFSGVVQQSPIVSINWTPTPRARCTSPTPRVGDACLVLASEEGEVSRWSIVGDRLDLVRLDSEISCMKSDGSCTVVACRDGSVRLLASPDGGGFIPTLNRESGLEGELTCLDIKPCGERGERGRQHSLGSSIPGAVAVVAIGSDNGAVRAWDVMQTMPMA